MTEKHISLELAKKLKEKGCELPSEYIYTKRHSFVDTKGDKQNLLISEHSLTNEYFYSNSLGDFKAYEFYDILVKYPKEFFGEHRLEKFKTVRIDGEEHRSNYFIYAWVFHTLAILRFLQKGNIKFAERYIEEHCVFTKKKGLK